MIKEIILYIGGFELPDKNAAAHRVLANAKCLRDIGYEVILVGISKDKDVDKNNFDVQGFKCYNIKYPKSNKEWLSYITSIKDYRFILDKEKPNKIIAYNFPALSLYRLLKLSGMKIYADVTEWYEPKGSFFYKVIKGLDVNLRMKYLHKKLDGLIVISDFLEEYYANKGVENIINVPPLVDASDEKWINDISSTNKEDTVFKFIYSGATGQEGKDRVDIVVESLKFFYVKKKIPLVLNVLGITKEYYIEYFNNNISLNAEYDFVVFHGRIPHIRSIYLLKNADFSVFFRENRLANNAGFPTKFVESISAGTPVITNDYSNLKNYFIGDDNCFGFIIDDLSPQEITRVFNEVFSINRETLCKCKKGCFESSSFDYRQYSDEFCKLLNCKLNE